MSTRRIIEAFDQWRSERQPVALATVFDTLGSTYTKAGHRIIIAANGTYNGLISGGCLEGDLAEHAARVLDSRSAQPVTYDLRDEVDDVFGLGVGCNGLIRVFIQPLLPEDDYQPFAALRTLYGEPEPSLSATVIETETRGIPAGSTFLLTEDGTWSSVGNADTQQFANLLNTHQGERTQAEMTARYTRIDGYGVLFAPLYPIPRLLVLGAGLDSVPLVRIAAELGWYVDLVDHRPAYLERDDLSAADSVRLVDPRDSRNTLGQAGKYDAAVVMSHHLETDAAYLRALAALDLRYLGVLGPPARRVRLLEKLEAEFPDLRRRLHGPIGLDIGGAGPEVIALSILAELQSVFSGRQ
jgi:xanthine/CO dehydrogenase XdhC/CoxF family maturation factor